MHHVKIILPILFSLFLVENISSQGLWLKKLQFGLGTSFATHDLKVEEFGQEEFVSSGFNYSWGILSLKWRYPLKKSWHIGFNLNYGRDYYRFSVHLDDQFYSERNYSYTYIRSIHNVYTNIQLGVEKNFLFLNHPKIRLASQAYLSIGGTSRVTQHGSITFVNDIFDTITLYELNGKFGNWNGTLYRLKINIGPAFSIGSHEMSITAFSSFNLTGQELARGEYKLFNGTSTVSTGTIKSKVNKVGIEFAFFFNAVSKRY